MKNPSGFWAAGGGVGGLRTVCSSRVLWRIHPEFGRLGGILKGL